MRTSEVKAEDYVVGEGVAEWGRKPSAPIAGRQLVVGNQAKWELCG